MRAPRVVVAALLAHWGCLASAQAPPDDIDVAMQSRFQDFLTASGKSYHDDDTFAQRLRIFSQNVAFIEGFNANRTGDDMRLGVNQFADLTAAEFKQTYLPGLTRKAPIAIEAGAAPLDVSGLPESVDWRAKGAVTPVKDQKLCGSCWAFSTTGAIEGAMFLAHGTLLSLSEEELVDCAHGGSNRGCSGGDPVAAFEWVEKNGICSDKSYPYTAYQDECHNQFSPCQVAAHIDGHGAVEGSNELALKAAVARQPVSVEIEADTDVFRFYKTGVFSSAECGAALDHAVLAVGYGTEAGKDYWLIKNSWNASWGDEGYIRLARTDSTASGGECGVALRPTYPVISGAASIVV